MPISSEAAEKVLTNESFDGLELRMGADLADLLKSGPATGDKRIQFQADCANLRQRLQRRRGFINPRRSHVQYWDMCTGLALVFTAIVTPFEVCLGLETKMDALFVINSIVNLIFTIDIVVQFFLPIMNPQTKELVRDHRELARRYLRFWFWLDFLSVLPFDMITIVAPGLFGAKCGGNSSLIKAIKLIRTMRLFKLLRMLRSSRIVQRWDSAISVSTSSRTMIFAWTTWAVAMHWLACIWVLLTQLQETYRDDDRLELAVIARLARNDTTSSACEACVCAYEEDSAICRNPCLTACEIEEMAAILGMPIQTVRESQSWLCRAVYKGWLVPDFVDHPMVVWAFGLAKVLGGLGPLGAVNAAESLVFSATGLAVRISFAVLQGLILRVLTAGDPDETKFRQRLDALNFMMRDQNVPNELRVRVRTYVTKTKQIVKRAGYFGLIDSSLSRQLRKEVRGVLSSGVFTPVWWLEGAEPAFLQELSNFTLREAFAEGEVIPHVTRKVGEGGKEVDEWRLCLLVSGVANRAGSIITSGAYWGDVILTNPLLRDSRAATAMSFCEVASLSRAGLDELSGKHPRSAAIIRQAALKLATKRAIMLAAMYYQINGAQLDRVKEGPRAPIKPSMTLKALHDQNVLQATQWREPDEPDGITAPPPSNAPMSPIHTPPKAKHDQSGAGAADIASSPTRMPPVAPLPPKRVPPPPSSVPSSGPQAFSHLVEKLDSLEASQTRMEQQLQQVTEMLQGEAKRSSWPDNLLAA